MKRYSGFSTINRYNPQGYLSSIARGDTERDIWRLEEMNPRGQIKRFELENGAVRQLPYSAFSIMHFRSMEKRPFVRLHISNCTKLENAECRIG